MSDIIDVKRDVTIQDLESNTQEGLIGKYSKFPAYRINIKEDVNRKFPFMIEFQIGSKEKGVKDPILLWYGPRTKKPEKDEPISKIFASKGKVEVGKAGVYIIVLKRPPKSRKNMKYGYELRIIGIESSWDVVWDRFMDGMSLITPYGMLALILTLVTICTIYGVSCCCGFVLSSIVYKMKNNFQQDLTLSNWCDRIV